MIGCTHNLERQIVFGKPNGGNPEGQFSASEGDVLTLHCPHGCPDITISLQPREEENPEEA